MRYSMMSYTISRQGPAVFDINKMLDLTKEIGMAGVDFVTLHGQTAVDLRKRCDDKDIAVVCHTVSGGGFLSDIPEDVVRTSDAVKAAIENAVVLGAPVIMVVTPGRADLSRSESRRRYIAGLKPIMGLAKAAGVRVTVENFPGKTSPFVTADDFLTAKRELPDLGLTFDSGNAASGEEPAESFARCASATVHAHFKDWTVLNSKDEGGLEVLNGLRFKPALIGEGVLNHGAVLKAMQKANYGGCINIEYEGPADPYEAIRKAVAYLREMESKSAV
jgi:sugar phosphate isomerase/epimerase